MHYLKTTSAITDGEIFSFIRMHHGTVCPPGNASIDSLVGLGERPRDRQGKRMERKWRKGKKQETGKIPRSKRDKGTIVPHWHFLPLPALPWTDADSKFEDPPISASEVIRARVHSLMTPPTVLDRRHCLIFVYFLSSWRVPLTSAYE